MHVVTVVLAFNTSVSLSHNRLMIVAIVVRLKPILSVMAMAVLVLRLLLLVAMLTVPAARFLVSLRVAVAVPVTRLVRLSVIIVSVRLSL